jgi:hypothetical protein
LRKKWRLGGKARERSRTSKCEAEKEEYEEGEELGGETSEEEAATRRTGRAMRA